MKKILYVGFKGKNNASCNLVNTLSQNPCLLTNSFEGLRKDIERLDVDFDYVLMFGLDPKLRNFVRIEQSAVRQGIRLETELDLDEVSKHIKAVGVESYISNTPTQYLCNEAYWFALQKFEKRAVFIHIPPTKYVNEEFMEKMKRAFSLCRGE